MYTVRNVPNDPMFTSCSTAVMCTLYTWIFVATLHIRVFDAKVVNMASGRIAELYGMRHEGRDTPTDRTT
jgi:hypothetical protein